MLCVLFLRSTVPRSSWGDNPGSISYSIYLTKWVTHDPSTAVRATTVLSFPQPTPLLGRTNVLRWFPRFQPSDFIPLRFVQHHGNVQLGMSPIGGWGRRKAGDWGRKPGRGRGIAAGLPPFPLGCLPKTLVEWYCVDEARRLSKTSHKQMVTPVKRSCVSGAPRP